MRQTQHQCSLIGSKVSHKGGVFFYEPDGMFDQMFGKFDQIFGAIQIDEGCFCRSGELSVEAKNSRTNGLFCI